MTRCSWCGDPLDFLERRAFWKRLNGKRWCGRCWFQLNGDMGIYLQGQMPPRRHD